MKLHPTEAAEAIESVIRLAEVAASGVDATRVAQYEAEVLRLYRNAVFGDEVSPPDFGGVQTQAKMSVG